MSRTQKKKSSSQIKFLETNDLELGKKVTLTVFFLVFPNNCPSTDNSICADTVKGTEAPQEHEKLSHLEDDKLS